MKILEINTVFGTMSTGRICAEIGEELEKKGHICKAVYSRKNVPDKYKNMAHHFGNDLSVIKDAALTRIFDNAGFNSKKVTKKLMKWVREYNPDIIHLHNLHGYYINIEVLFNYIKKEKKPVVWTLHDCWAFTGHCAHFASVGCEKWKEGCHTCSKKHTYPKSLISDASKRNYQRKKNAFTGVPNLTITTPSRWLADLVKQSFLKEYPVKVINNGIETEVFKHTESDFKEKYGLEGKKLILGVSNTWGKEKGLYDFYKLSEMLEENERIILVGVTEEQKKELPNGIIGITHTHSKKELACIYTEADVFLNPTYEDTYPTVNMEAQACGTPVVTYKTGGSVENVPSENVVMQGDVLGLKEKMRENLTIKNQIFNNKKMISEYISLFEEVFEK